MTDVICCASCEKQLPPEEADEPNRDTNGDVICQDCWDKSFCLECAKCGDWMEEYCAENIGRMYSVSQFLAVTQEGIKPGVYQITDHPIFERNTFHLIPDNLKLITSEPAGWDSGYICPDCTKKYKEQYGLAE